MFDRLLKDAVASYARTLGLYAEVWLAIEQADAERYRAGNRRGRVQDEACCAALEALLACSRNGPLDLDVPPAIAAIVEKQAAYRRAAGGAIAFWE
jgi:hypothetical protein